MRATELLDKCRSFEICGPRHFALAQVDGYAASVIRTEATDFSDITKDLPVKHSPCNDLSGLIRSSRNVATELIRGLDRMQATSNGPGYKPPSMG